MADLKCNRCFSGLGVGDKCIITNCGHVFCYPCGEATVNAGANCQACGGSFTRRDVKAIEIFGPDSSRAATSLLGQTPVAALAAATAAVKFYQQQQAMMQQAMEQQLKRQMQEKIEQKTAKVKKQCEEHLGKVHAAYKTAKRKAGELQAEVLSLRKDLDELADKYQHKSKQARHLQDMLKHGSGGGGGGGRMGGGGGGVALARMSPMLDVGRGGGGGGMAHGQHMVTTVRQTQAVFDIPSPSPSNMLAGNLRQHMLASSAGFNAAAGRLHMAASAGKHGVLRQSPALPPESPAVPHVGARGMFEPSSAGRSGLAGIGMAAAGARMGGGAGAALTSLLGHGGGGVLRGGGGGGQSGLLPRAGIAGVMMSPSINTM